MPDMFTGAQGHAAAVRCCHHLSPLGHIHMANTKSVRSTQTAWLIQLAE